MVDDEFLKSLGILILTAAVFVLLARVIRMPAIVVYLLAGVVIGPMLGLVRMSSGLELISEAGIALLLFLVGLELSFEKIRAVGPVAVAAGLGQVVFTALGGFVLSWGLGFGMMESVFLSTALTFSSTVVVVKLLDEKGELDSLYGRIAVGIFLVQNLVVIVMLTLLAGLGDSGAIDPKAVTLGILKAFGGMGLMLVAALVSSRHLLARPFAWAARSPEMLFIWALSWCFLFVLGAHALGLSLEVGAFLAGLSLAQLPYNDDLRRRMHPLMNFFIAVFFVSLGIRMELGAAWDALIPTTVLSLFVLIGNPLIFMIIITRMGYRRRTSFLTSVTVAQISEFSFIFVGMGVANGLIGHEIMSVTAFVGVVTIPLSAYLILYNHPLYEFCRRWGLLKWFGSDNTEEPQVKSTGLSRHIIVVGMNTLGRRLVNELSTLGETVIAVDTDPVKLQGLPGVGMLGNVEYLSVLEEAGLGHARLLVCTLNIEDTNDLLAHRCKMLGIPCALNVVDLSVIDNLVDLDAAYLLVPKVDGVKAQVRKLKDLGYITS